MEEPRPTNFDLPYTRLLDEEAANEQPFIDHEQRPRQHLLKLFIVLLTVFFCVGLIFGFSRVVEFRSLSLGSPADEKIDEVLPRGVAEGVSLKSFRWPLWELKLPSFPWSPKMLSFERTSFHFQPKKNWMNDPNGPLFYKGWYHLFYQYNPDGAVWGNKIVWGHAVSKDFMQWQHLPVAMYTDKWYDVNGVWTGSATILPDGKVIMLYTGSTNESVQVQNLAYPADPSDPFLVEWIKYPNNPVLYPPPGIGYKDFRDPTTAWQTSEGKWRITIGSKLNKTGISLVYDTVDFKSYELLKGLLHEVKGTGMWECVDFFPVSIDGTDGLDTSYMAKGVKHVVKVSLDDDRCDYYSLGTYEPKTATWIPDNPNVDAGIGLRYDYGIYYASKTFYDPNKKRRILWGWIKETDSEKSDVKKGWASLQAVPRTILFDKKTGSNLIQWPVDEVEELRSNKKVFDKVEIKPGSVMPLDIGSAAQLDIKAEFELDEKAIERVNAQQVVYNCSGSGGAADRGALGPFGLLILADNDLTELTPVYFYIYKGPSGNLHTLFCADHSRSSVAGDVDKGIYGSTVPVLNGEKLTVRILVDHSIVESFAQGGRTCITSRVYPTKAIGEKAKLYLFNNATESTISASIETYQMTMTTSAAHTYTRINHILMLAFISLLLHWILR
ncbi:acid beta-fructofuranosidase-like isoform X2 [Apium graveolens]|uniref:acid beta-fructofuranosidase-like isoform X2 n=2 Tax=Apium graveolens TaxID=4045 RepID=UPI003D7A4D79